MKATNSIAPAKQNKVTFSAAITGDSLQNLIRKSVASPEAAARFTGTLISAVAASPQLQNCKPATVVAAALRGEGMGLTLGREYHLVPFADNCAYVIGYKGLIALCLAGNDVSDMDCIEVREGELVGRDKRTKRQQFDFSVYQTDEEASKHPVIGYYAYCEFANGRFRFEYMSISDILDHAQRYSRAFDIEKYKKLQSGMLNPQETERLMQGSPWYSSFDTMCKKTVIRKLLNSGYVRLANSAAVRDAINYDSSIEENIIPDIEIPVSPSGDFDTGEVIETTAPQNDTPAPAEDQVEEEKPKRGRPKKRLQELAEEEAPDDEAINSFFEEAGAR